MKKNVDTDIVAIKKILRYISELKAVFDKFEVRSISDL